MNDDQERQERQEPREPWESPVLPEPPGTAAPREPAGMREPREQPLPPEERFRGARTALMLSTAGLTLALSIAVGVGIGVLLDRWLGTNWLVIVFTLLGVFAGFRELIRIVIRANAEQEAQEAEERDRRDRGG
jgi:F0F1-type ATP synthase assembly protein I